MNYEITYKFVGEEETHSKIIRDVNDSNDARNLAIGYIENDFDDYEIVDMNSSLLILRSEDEELKDIEFEIESFIELNSPEDFLESRESLDENQVEDWEMAFCDFAKTDTVEDAIRKFSMQDLFYPMYDID